MDEKNGISETEEEEWKKDALLNTSRICFCSDVSWEYPDGLLGKLGSPPPSLVDPASLCASVTWL